MATPALPPLAAGYYLATHPVHGLSVIHWDGARWSLHPITVTVTDPRLSGWTLTPVDGIARLAEERDLAKAETRAIEHMLCRRLGGKVEGRPTAAINYLQRVDELREIEKDRKAARAELARVREALRSVLLGIGIHNERDVGDGKLAKRIEGPVIDAANRALANPANPATDQGAAL